MTNRHWSVVIRVAKGQIYRVPRRGKAARHVQVAGVRKGQQPKASYFLVTRTGNRAEAKSTPLRVTWLTWDGRAWVPPAQWELLG